MAARALGVATLTAARSGETRGKTWGEVDLEKRIWSIPAERMKAGKEHRVPPATTPSRISARAATPPRSCLRTRPNPQNPSSNMSSTTVLHRVGRSGIIVHGFRSMFRDRARDWAGETTGFPREVIEAALAHGIKDKAEAAYARSDLFDKRRDLVDAWASVATQQGLRATVVSISERV